MSADQSEEVEEVEDVEEAGSADKSGRVPWLPLVVVLLVVPIITIAGMEFVVIPKLKSALAVSSGAESAAKAEKPAKADSHGGGHGGGKDAPANAGTSYKFEEMVTNVAGTMGTRFIKASFEVFGSSADLRSKLHAREAQVQDAIMTVLAGRTIKELEAVGGRNALRIDLVEAINSALGQGMVDELYFLELIIQ